jgi:hypothetical protein
MSRETELQEELAGLDEDRKGTREHVDLLNKLAGDIAFTQPARSFELAGQAEGLSRDLGYRKGVADSQCNQAYHHFQAGRHQEALEVSGKISMATPSKRPSFLEPPS